MGKGAAVGHGGDLDPKPAQRVSDSKSHSTSSFAPTGNIFLCRRLEMSLGSFPLSSLSTAKQP